jgi:very-short-patch-repair endonuclease
MTTDKAYDPTPTIRARTLRNDATPAERRLWTALRNRQIEGVRFNRQVPVGPFICDFVARSVKLVVEADGGQHGEAIDYDEARTRYLEARGYKVLRFWNDEIMRNLNGVVTTILNALVDLRAIPPLPPEWEGKRPEGPKGRAFRSGNGEFPVAPTGPPPLAARVDPSRSGGRG